MGDARGRQGDSIAKKFLDKKKAGEVPSTVHDVPPSPKGLQKTPGTRQLDVPNQTETATQNTNTSFERACNSDEEEVSDEDNSKAKDNSGGSEHVALQCLEKASLTAWGQDFLKKDTLNVSLCCPFLIKIFISHSGMFFFYLYGRTFAYMTV